MEKEYVQYALCNNDTNTSHKYNIPGHREQDIIYCPIPTYNIYKKEITSLGTIKEVIIESFKTKKRTRRVSKPKSNHKIKNKNRNLYSKARK